MSKLDEAVDLLRTVRFAIFRGVDFQDYMPATANAIDRLLDAHDAAPETDVVGALVEALERIHKMTSGNEAGSAADMVCRVAENALRVQRLRAQPPTEQGR